MDLLKNFVGNIVQSMPHVSKVAYVSTQIKKYLRQLDEEENEKFSEKFVNVLKMFVDQKITLKQMCMVIDAADVALTKLQINYFCNQTYLNGYLIDLIQKYIECRHLNDAEIHYVAEFIVIEINKAIINT
ncbi:AC75 [Trabala vishnou gigantina nucleopolyhedrovirus]|uniref:AC75 n=1 Tax=Trabala vishnou gigantina nucleopolyhedrovirus TaxID=2863583 RepID=UPI002481A7FE|nr:AC75 [Trabala vishnou gigantina nucleopolyhedrovirus]QYC92764.1 AC75 [Trabala vishnou gigantina nucleopolyhedrovirus]